MAETNAQDPQLTQDTTHSFPSRLLHLLIALGVSLQLLWSTFMEKPRPGRVIHGIEALGFTLHEIFGLALLPLLLAWFVWLWRRRGEVGPKDMFPWFGQRLQAVIAAVRVAIAGLRQRRLAPDSEIRPLVRAVHGLGALCALAMALTGTVVWLGMAANGSLTPWAHWVLEVHETIANLMWAYLFGHAGMALLHHLRGEPTLRRMWTLRRTPSA